ncbi:hypothetical protein F2P81_001498 [Scophthalmus maximus]|uniref:Uncharacterized protein n=1 Tax=Scophthalmus maximus TaxID=52904 RepID=A0A6A4TJI7_SCOMX|nr:hypothetical protein F2P81_001498 [Scophthalmus maximus]
MRKTFIHLLQIFSMGRGESLVGTGRSASREQQPANMSSLKKTQAHRSHISAELLDVESHSKEKQLVHSGSREQTDRRSVLLLSAPSK